MRAIDADALKEDLRMGKECDIDCPTDWKACHYDRVYAKQDFCEWIDDAPTIEPERKKGKWIDSHTTCSECGWQMIDDVIESPNIVAFNFCPNCGARMEDE